MVFILRDEDDRFLEYFVLFIIVVVLVGCEEVKCFVINNCYNMKFFIVVYSN